MIKYVDLFCGIGGFRIGLESAFADKNKECHCVLSCDIKSHALRVYNKNFNEQNKETDITKLDIENLADFDILCGGFPCQAFSSAGSKNAFKDKRGLLIFDVLDICKQKKPRIIILENVPNLLTIQSGEIFNTIMKSFEEIGYNMSYKILDAIDFGVSQNRKRLFIVGCTDKAINMDAVVVYQSKAAPLANVIDKDDMTVNIPENFYNALLKLPDDKLIGAGIKDKRGGESNIHSWDLELFGKIDETDKGLLNKLMTERRKKHWADKKKIKWQDGMPLTSQEIATFITIPDLVQRLENLVSLGYLSKEKPKDLIDGKRKYKEDAEEGYNISS
jgi:DNA (cytosine-5)-methyltransferase 1